MHASVLTLDLGNSALKVMRWGDSPQWLACSWTQDWSERLQALLAEPASSALRRALLSSVVPGQRLDAALSMCESAGLDVLVNPEPPLAISCRDAHTIGKDRLYAAAGAWAQCREALLVVDAGTALTVDAVAVGTDQGEFLGGAIAAGPSLLASALSTGARQLFEVDYDPLTPALGRDSREALRAGVAHGFHGAAKELVRRISIETQLELAPIWLTGGARAALSAPGFFGERVVRDEPRLVHLGLLAAAGVRVE